MIRFVLLLVVLGFVPSASAEDFFTGGEYATVSVPTVTVTTSGVTMGTYSVPGARPLCQCILGRPADTNRRVIAVCLATSPDEVTITAFVVGNDSVSLPARTWAIRCLNPAQ